jgi:VCBS repeat-containing protein
MPDSAFDFLALGEAVTIGYNVTVTDNNGASVVEPLTIKVLGSADGPVFGNNTFDTNQDAAITSPIQFTLADEGRSASGFGIRQDVLPNGVVLTSPPSSSLPSLGHFSVTQAGAFTFDPGHDYDYLAQGETATETATVLVATDAGLSFTPVSVTVHGTNDAPVIAASTATGAITEQPGVTGSSVPDTASGEIDFRDADVSDTHTVTTDGASITFNPASPITDPARQKGVNAALDGLAKRLALDHPLQLSLSDTNGGAIGSVGWTFSRPDGALISWRRATR